MKKFNVFLICVACLGNVRCLSIGNVSEAVDVQVTEAYANLTMTYLDLDQGLEANTTEEAELVDESYDLEDEENSSAANSTAILRLAGGTAAVAKQFLFAMSIQSTVGSITRWCTGALITVQYVLTAASCVYDASTVLVKSAVLVSTAGDPANAIVHPKYVTNSHNYNIALLKLATPLVVSATVDIISLAPKKYVEDNKYLVGKFMTVLGFGLPSPTGTAGLNYNNMEVMSSSKCLRALKNSVLRLGSHQSCLDTKSAYGSLGMCSQDDMGGPVVYRFGTNSQYSLVGIMTNYESCGSSVPNLFTRIGPYWDFLRQYIPINNI